MSPSSDKSKEINLSSIPCKIKQINFEGSFSKTTNETLKKISQPLLKDDESDWLTVITSLNEIQSKLVSSKAFKSVEVLIDAVEENGSKQRSSLNNKRRKKKPNPNKEYEITMILKESGKVNGSIQGIIGANQMASTSSYDSPSTGIMTSIKFPNLIGSLESASFDYKLNNLNSLDWNNLQKNSSFSAMFEKPIITETTATSSKRPGSKSPEPILSDWPYFRTFLFKTSHEQNFSFFSNKDLGIGKELDFKFLANRLSYLIRAEGIWRQISPIVLTEDDAIIPNEIKADSGNSLKLCLKNILCFDSRSSKMLPTDGFLARLTNEMSNIQGNPGNVNFVKNEADFQANFPIFLDYLIKSSPNAISRRQKYPPISINTSFKIGFLQKVSSFKTNQTGYNQAIKKSNNRILINEKFFVPFNGLMVRGYKSGTGLGPGVKIPTASGSGTHKIATGGNVYWISGLSITSGIPFAPNFWSRFIRCHTFINSGSLISLNEDEAENEPHSSLLKKTKNGLSQAFDVKNIRSSLGIGVISSFSDFIRIELNYVIPLKRLLNNDSSREEGFDPGFNFGFGIHFS